MFTSTCVRHICVSEVWDFVEYFAGCAAVSRALKHTNLPGVSLDKDYEGKAMDILTDSGMGLPGLQYVCFILCLLIVLVVVSESLCAVIYRYVKCKYHGFACIYVCLFIQSSRHLCTYIYLETPM